MNNLAHVFANVAFPKPLASLKERLVAQKEKHKAKREEYDEETRWQDMT